MKWLSTLLGFFGGGAGGYVGVALAAALAVAAGLVWWQAGAISARDRMIGERNTALQAAQQANGRLAAAIDQQAAIFAAGDKASAALADQRQARDARVRTIIKEVYRDREIAIPAGCPAVSPVLLDGLDRLRRLRAGEADHGIPGPARPDSRELAALRR